MKKNIFHALCLLMFAGMVFASCESENNYIVTVVSIDETMGKAFGGGEYASGTTTRIWAVPEVGYQFDHWNDGNTENPRNITVNSDITYVAHFATIGDNPSDPVNPGGNDSIGHFNATLTVDGISYQSIALISYGMDQQTGNYLSLQLILGEGSEADPSFYLYILPQTGTQGFAQGVSCAFIENADDFVIASNGGEYPHYQTINGCNYSINVTAFDMTTQAVTLSSSGELFDIKRAEAGEGAHKINYSVTIDGAWQYPSTPSQK